jgi:hypothetical protein
MNPTSARLWMMRALLTVRPLYPQPPPAARSFLEADSSPVIFLFRAAVLRE